MNIFSHYLLLQIVIKETGTRKLNNHQVADWLHECEKTLDFIFNNAPNDLTNDEAACTDNEHEQVAVRDEEA